MICILVIIILGLIFYPSGAWHEKTGGPKVNFQSLVSGNMIPIPESVGDSYTYGYYQGNERVGEFKGTLAGTESYMGVECYKINADFNMKLTVMNISVATTGTGYIYYEVNGLYPKFMQINYYYTKPSTMTMTMNITWDRASSEMILAMNLNGQSTSATATFPPSYWESISNLTIGFTKTIDYNIRVGTSYSENVTLRASVTGIENVNVPKGDFNDCYIVNVKSNSRSSAVDMTIWVSKENIVPKAEINMQVGTASVSLIMELEHYGTSG